MCWLRLLRGISHALVGGDQMSIDDIYQKAAKKFKVNANDITQAIY